MFRRRKMTKMMITGVLLGGATGSILTFLFTPKSGRELRGDIKNTMDNSVEKVKTSTSNIYTGAKNVTTGAISKIQSAFNAGISSYRNATEKVKTSKEMVEESLAEENTGSNI
ncbi:MAG: YtxH domain-containing protein [Ignavibacteria bacterium]|jgi:gas vesicle protein|nr:YtxH domain-containing protein [Ignavibacteria bacterium]MCU7503952.1 YtxH domain-containing protein [Ignavibacteria bacterium]MCU7515827.1 YtxH domain-containing protein [Ignavibacteria bacterium]